MASYFWVGGSGTWNNVNTANWAILSGGVGGFGPPLAADTVTFDSASGTGTCTTAAGSACATATLNSSTLGVTLGANHSMSGSFALTLGILSLGSFKLTCNNFTSSNSNVRTIDFGTGDITLTANASTVINMSTGTNAVFLGTPTFNLTYAGATGTRTVSISAAITNRANINISAGSDIFTLASSYANNVNFTGFSGSWTNSAWRMTGNLTVSAGMTVSAGTLVPIFLGTSVTQQITTNGKTFDFPMVFNGVGSTFAFQDALTQGSTRAFTIVNGTVQFKSGVTSAVGSFATSSTNQKFLQSTLAGSQATLSQASGTVSATNLVIRDINATGGATWNAFTTSGNIDAGNNTGWDFFTQLGKYIYTRRKNKRILL